MFNSRTDFNTGNVSSSAIIVIWTPVPNKYCEILALCIKCDVVHAPCYWIVVFHFFKSTRSIFVGLICLASRVLILKYVIIHEASF